MTFSQSLMVMPVLVVLTAFSSRCSSSAIFLRPVMSRTSASMSMRLPDMNSPVRTSAVNVLSSLRLYGASLVTARPLPRLSHSSLRPSGPRPGSTSAMFIPSSSSRP